MPTYCVIDQKEIPEDRERRKAVTCCKECKQKLTELRRKHKDKKVCRMCFRPSTAEERKLYQQWRRQTFPPAKKGRPKKVKPEDVAPESSEANG